MGWKALYKNGKIENEDDPGVGRPVQAGENGELLVVAQEDFGHKVAVDLVNGVICLDYDSISMQNGSVELENPKIFLYICEGDTNILAGFMHRYPGEPDEKGDYFIDYKPLLWRPIWFTRVTNGVPTKVIGAQTTTPSDIDPNSGKELGFRNVKKTISIFADGRMGID